MDSTKAQQMALDEALVATTNRLNIGKGNQRLSPNLKSNEATIQVVLDALKLTPVYNAFLVTASVPEIYMQEFWVTVTLHHTSLRFKLNAKSHTLNMENFRDMLNIYPRLQRERFQDPPVDEEILSFHSDLGHSGEIRVSTNVNSVHSEEPSHNVEDTSKHQHQEYVMWETDEQPDDNEATKANWFKKPERPPTPDSDWSDVRSTSNHLRLGSAKLLELKNLLLHSMSLMPLRTCKSLIELEYHLEECSKATAEKLDWNNPENKPYPFNLRKLLSLIQDHRGCQIIPKDYFINKDLEYLNGGNSSISYSTSVTKTKVASYNLKLIEDMVYDL
nr:hypothetical protein [Tanacetum cinerariifolium]